MHLRKLAASTLALAVALAAGTAAAQYQWRDENGRMTFSDRPPPGSVRPADVVRHPGLRAAPHEASVGAARAGALATGVLPASPAALVPSAAPAGKAAATQAVDGGTDPAARRLAPHGPSTAADRELAFRKRQLERAEAERKLVERAAHVERQARACEEVRASQRTLESGMRLAQVDARGEREFLSEQARAQRLDAVRRDVQDLCEAG